MKQGMPEYTAGPWHATRPALGFANIVDANGDLILAVCYPSLGMKDKARSEMECAANLQLAVSAPDLLKACEAARKALLWLRDSENWHRRSVVDARSQLDAAIARATGEGQ